MKYLQMYKRLILSVVVFMGFFIFLQIHCSFHYFFIEQNQLFLNTWAYLSGYLFKPDGFALMLSEFLVQFFIYPYMGAVIMAALLTAITIFTDVLLRKIAPSIDGFFLSLFPSVALLLVHFDFNYLTFGTVAYMLMAATACLTVSIKRFDIRLIAHFVAVLILYYAAGAVFILYAIIALLCELFGNYSRRYLSLLLPGIGLLMGILSVYFAVYGEYRFIFLPDGYYHTSLKPKTVIYFSWITIIILVIIANILKKRKVLTPKRAWIENSIITVFVAIFFIWGIKKYNDERSNKVKEFDYYSRTEQWDKILRRSQGPLNNYLFINYANLALMQKGELGNKVFAYEQHGLKGMLPDWDKTFAVSVLHSDIYFAMNLVASSQQMAFEANVSAIGYGNPRTMKRLVETNLIYGAYSVAEKYIDILENTFAYRDWAKDKRRLLNNDKAVYDDDILGPKKKLIDMIEGSSLIDAVEDELLYTSSDISYGRTSAICAGTLCLLAKDITGFQVFLDGYFNTSALPQLPVSFQEAVILFAEKDMDIWKKFGVSNAVISRFAEFRKQVVAANRSGTFNALPTVLKQDFGDTYWYYYMFKNL